MGQKWTRSMSKGVQFVDWKRVYFIGGGGGDGCCSFRREANMPRGGPDGGNGGNGGAIWLKSTRNRKDLSSLRKPQYTGERGGNGKGSNCHGKTSKDLILNVPVGTVIRESGQVVSDLDKYGTSYCIAKGGKGGRGNRSYLSNSNRAPRQYELGDPGERKVVELELKIIADVGLVGFPNAGKSTLLRAISNAKPKVAAYPFTTLNPHIGIIEYEDSTQVAVADIPGLVVGAHENKGLGHSFLRHIERCHGLLYVIDASADNPRDHYFQLAHELERYKNGLSLRPAVIVANKIDLERGARNVLGWANENCLPVCPVSGMEQKNIAKLKEVIRNLSRQ
eukprot:m.11051 g.11051  ORF g.11051 m.11051 type:complete len:336 (+) comp22936_c0_seq2:186-1193(+)